MKILPFACMALVTSISSAYSEQAQAHAIWFAERESPRVHRRPVCLSQATLPDSFKLS
ncbi:hypothetical protein ND6B_0450 [Pseudoalteromonas sp. ND6B]|nr:hypothetical protein ND6B_0450 [Pseudoalteromonas sp. ND6B]